jgi:hypothetical protein
MLFTVVLIALLVIAAIYIIDPTFFGLFGPSFKGVEGYEDVVTVPAGGSAASAAKGGPMNVAGEEQEKENKKNPHVAEKPEEKKEAVAAEGFQDIVGYDGGDDFAATSAGGCYMKDQLTPAELLPKDQNSVWASQNPMTGSLKGKQFLSAGALMGINTVGGSLRNASHQLRSEPANPQTPVSVWMQSTIEPDINRRPLEMQ